MRGFVCPAILDLEREFSAKMGPAGQPDQNVDFDASGRFDLELSLQRTSCGPKAHIRQPLTSS